MLRRLRGWFLIGALLICGILFAGLVHDFSVNDPAAGWFTGNPVIPGVLLGLGYLFMLANRFGSRGG